jgi:hypothetical protein
MNIEQNIKVKQMEKDLKKIRLFYIIIIVLSVIGLVFLATLSIMCLSYLLFETTHEDDHQD